MDKLLQTTLIGLLFGTVGTTIGGIIGIKLKNTSNRFLSFILELAAGLMTAIVCFELIPEAFELTGILSVFLGIIFGLITMVICEGIINKKYIKKKNMNSLLKTGVIVGIGLAIHNFPEGLAIGSGFGSSVKLGISLALAIAIHDVPEGISMSVPMKAGGMSAKKALIYTMISGITTGIGAFLGSILGTISQDLIGVCLAFAAGAMLYIVSGELIPESNKLYRGRLASIGNMLGFIMGVIVTRI